MDNSTHSFEDWFDTLVNHLAEEGVHFSDQDSVRSDYEDGKDVFDVIDDIKDEYQ